MATIKINNYEKEFDVFELENAIKYRDGLALMQEAIKKADTDTDFVASIERQCKAVFQFIDSLFGEGEHVKIFGKSCNLVSCLNVYKSIVGQISAEATAQTTEK